MDRYAQTVFVDGPVLTEAGEPAPGAVAVRGGRIVATDADEVRYLTGPSTEVVSLRGRLLIPGFVDAHVHPFFAGLELGRCNLLGIETREETLQAVRTYADEHPELEWITGAGWSKNAFPRGLPHRSDLDAVVPDRPVLLIDNSHHSGWANSIALQRAGIHAQTPDPEHGRIGHDPDGSPSGNLFESATELVSRFVPAATQDERDAGLLRAQAHLHSVGVTGWQDAIVGEYLGNPDPFETYVRFAADGRLTARVVGALWWQRERGLDQLDDLRDRRERSVGSFRATSVKIMQDGVAETGTAAMLAPYFDGCGCRTGNTGTSFVDPDALKQYVTALDRDGWQVHFHALGDRAVREALDAIESAAGGFEQRSSRIGPPRLARNRHHLAHLQVIDPEDLPRFGNLGVTANLQALWACNDRAMRELTIPLLGADRARLQYPFDALHADGAHLCMGSDWPISSANPLDAIEVAVTRVEPGTDAEPFLPEQSILLAAAMEAYTRGSAWINGQDDAGVIGVGEPADIVVLDRDPFTGPPSEIHNTRVLATYVDGGRVYEHESL